MRELSEEERLIRQYLLRQLDDEERRRFEERVFTDHAYMERVLMAEDELVEDFVFGELPEPDRGQFTEHFLSTPQQTQKLEFTRALKEHAARTAPDPEPHSAGILAFLQRHKRFMKLTLATALLLAVLAGAWLLTPDPMARELALLNNPEAGLSVGTDAGDYPVTLTPVRVRGEAGTSAGVESVTIPAGASVVRLRLALMSEGYDRYRVTLQRDGEAAPLIVDRLKEESGAGGRIIPVRIPARLLTPGYYQLTLSGHADGNSGDELDSYTFRVVAKS